MRPTLRPIRGALSLLAALILPATPAPAAGNTPPAAGGYSGDPAPVTAHSGTTTDGALLSRRNELVGRRLAFQGTVAPRFAGMPVALQRLGRDGTWAEVARTVARADGSFRTTWTTDHIGRFTMRALPLPADAATAAAPPTATRQVTVFRPAVATIFGPGLFGHRTACGQRLTRRLQGVAHRTLPCGTLVDVFHRRRTVTVPVVDRGPFREGASWDLTSATAEAVRLTRTATIGAVRVREPAPRR